MLRINENTHASRAKSYYTAPSMADYYTEGHGLAEAWHGNAATRRRLSGKAELGWDLNHASNLLIPLWAVTTGAREATDKLTIDSSARAVEVG